MKFKLLRGVVVAIVLPLTLLWVQAARAAGVPTLLIAATILAGLLAAGRLRDRARGRRLLIECATAIAMVCFLIWISGSGARPVY